MNESLSNDEQELNPTNTTEEAVTEQMVEGDLKQVAELVQRLTQERDQINEQLLRTMADFQNFRKRNQQEQTLIRQYATENLVMSLLPVLDNFERTVQAADRGATMESVVTGVKAVEKQLRFLIEQQNVSRIPSLGQPFDANLHEALGTVVTEDYEPDTVVDELEPGYKMGEKVIRPAKVRVSVKP
jgi:molecular chaperone GrpE